MSAVIGTPQPQKHAESAAAYASSLKLSLATGTTGRGPMSTDIIIGNIDSFSASNGSRYAAFADLSPDFQASFHDAFVEQIARDYAFAMACGKVAIEHQDGVVAKSGNSPIEVQRKQTLLTAIAGAQRCFAKHAYGAERGPSIH